MLIRPVDAVTMPVGRHELSRVEYVARMLDPRRSYAVTWEDGTGQTFEVRGRFAVVNVAMWAAFTAGGLNIMGFAPDGSEDTFLFPVSHVVESEEWV